MTEPLSLCASSDISDLFRYLFRSQFVRLFFSLSLFAVGDKFPSRSRLYTIHRFLYIVFGKMARLAALWNFTILVSFSPLLFRSKSHSIAAVFHGIRNGCAPLRFPFSTVCRVLMSPLLLSCCRWFVICCRRRGRSRLMRWAEDAARSSMDMKYIVCVRVKCTDEKINKRDWGRGRRTTSKAPTWTLLYRNCGCSVYGESDPPLPEVQDKGGREQSVVFRNLQAAVECWCWW